MLVSAKNSRISQSEQQIERSAIDINQKTQILTKLFDQKTDSHALLSEFYQLVPTGISVQSVELSIEKGELSIRGQAYTRNDLLLFKQKLQSLGNVKLPITSFVSKQDLGYQIIVVLSKDET